MVNVGLESLGLLKQILAAQSTLFPSKSRGASEYVKDVLLQVGKLEESYLSPFDLYSSFSLFPLSSSSYLTGH